MCNMKTIVNGTVFVYLRVAKRIALESSYLKKTKSVTKCSDGC